MLADKWTHPVFKQLQCAINVARTSRKSFTENLSTKHPG